MADLSL